MPAFEPSTWAEVKEAAATDRALHEDPFVTQIRNFTNAPERFLTQRPVSPPHPSEDKSESSVESLSRARARGRRGEGQFDDLLGFGRVDLETEALVRRQVASIDDVTFPSDSRSAINPSSDIFDPAKYLALLHVDSTRDQLAQGKNTLARLRKRLDGQVETCRGEKYVSAALVAAAFEGTKAALLPLSPFDDDGLGEDTEQVFEKAEAMLKERYEDVMKRETKLAKLQRTRTVFDHYKWVFNLGERMRTAATEDVAAIEEAMREYSRGVKWLDAQDAINLTIVQKDFDSGFRAIVDAVVERLSSAHSTRREASRLVAILGSAQKEELLADALAKRMSFAQEGLQKAMRSADVAPMISIPISRRFERESKDLVARASSGFIEGLSHIWRLGRVLMGQDRWMRIVEGHIVTLCESYAKIVRDTILEDTSLITQAAVKEISSVRAKAARDMSIPGTYLGPLEEVNSEVTEVFVRSLSNAVRSGADQVAIQAMRNDTVGVSSAKLIQALVVEAMSQIDATLFRGKEGLDEKAPESRSKGMIEARGAETDMRVSAIDFLGRTCAEAPAVFGKRVYEQMETMQTGLDIASLKVAACSSELATSVLHEISRRCQGESPFDLKAIQSQLDSSRETLARLESGALKTHVALVSAPLKTLATSLIAFPEEEMGDLVSRTVPIKIEGVSKGANELVLQLALLMIATRRRSSNTSLIRHLLLHLISAVGDTLVQVLSTDKLAYHRAAQLWVDVTYMQEMVTKGATAEATGVQEAVDGFSRVKERAVQAVLADGYSFSLADMQMLRESVILGSMAESSMLCECFAETWDLLKDSEESD